jgi:cytidylate kinase
MEHRGVGRAAAEAWLREREQGQRDFVRHQFHHDLTDPRLYDLVINLERLDHQAAADLITHAFRHASGRPARDT